MVTCSDDDGFCLFYLNLPVFLLIKYTEGGTENLEISRSYFAQACLLNPTNLRALFGLLLVSRGQFLINCLEHRFDVHIFCYLECILWCEYDYLPRRNFGEVSYSHCRLVLTVTQVDPPIVFV
ncbi:unnamed protein product [Schistocephalus solidus]|uniref:ER membrane protein complex subunit 2 n=1 Tax=Schistocephalus solidus TaxID=70667 RepID=A0A183TP40_SCHSO|nr:unnamed protein product [Schistocephalus solidus]